MNKVILMGNIANDIELKQSSQSGKNLTRFRIACRRSRDDTDFINCVAFDKTAELIAKHFSKGSKILVEGSIRTGSYDGRDGKKVYTFDVYVSAIDFPEKAGQKADGQTAAPPAYTPPYQGQQAPPAPAYDQPPQNYPDFGYPDYPLPY